MAVETPPPLTARQRGRPARSALHIEDMKARIVAAAHQVFMVDGFDAVSMRRLATELGCTVMTVYKYFPRKIDILQALWTHVFDELFDELRAEAVKQTDPTARLQAIAMGYVRFWLERREHYFLVFMSSNVEQSDVSIFVQDEALLSRFDMFRQAISAAAAEPLTSAELELKAELLLCMLNGIAQNLVTISGYPWSGPEALVGAAIRATLSA